MVVAFAALIAVSCTSSGGPGDDVIGGVSGSEGVPGGGPTASGVGDGEVDIEWLGDTGPVLVKVTCECEEMSALTVFVDGEDEPIVDSLGPFAGTTMVTNRDSKKLTVRTLDEWAVQFLPASQAKPYSGVRLTGEGTTVLANRSPGGPTRVTFSPDPDDLFAASSTFVVAEAGFTAFRNQGPTAANISLSTEQDNLILVSGDGPWTIERAQGPTVERPDR